MSLSCCCGCCCQKQTLCPPPEDNLCQIFFINSWLPWCWGPSCRSGERSQQHLCLVCKGVRATCCTALQVSGKIKNAQEKADPPSLMYVSTGLMPATTTLTITWSSPTSGTGTLPSTWLNISLTLHMDNLLGTIPGELQAPQIFELWQPSWRARSAFADKNNWSNLRYHEYFKQSTLSWEFQKQSALS